MLTQTPAGVVRWVSAPLKEFEVVANVAPTATGALLDRDTVETSAVAAPLKELEAVRASGQPVDMIPVL